MFAELPKLFDRNFAIGFFLPFALSMAVSLVLIDHYGLSPVILPTLQQDLIVGGTVYGLVSWLGGILLLVTNHDLYRFFEGYGRYNPLRIFARLELARFHRINSQINHLDNEFRKCLDTKTEFPPELKLRRNRLMIEMVERFPNKESQILPTPFGNTLRAFEAYPRVMYGFESIDGWSRLLAVIPKDYRELIDSSKAHVDFWVNIGFLSSVLLVGTLILWGVFGTYPPIWLLITIIIILSICPWRARRLAVAWGDYVKSAFDIYRFNLLDTLGIKRPETREEELETWKSFSQAIVYRLPKQLPTLNKEKSNPNSN